MRAEGATGTDCETQRLSEKHRPIKLFATALQSRDFAFGTGTGFQNNSKWLEQTSSFSSTRHVHYRLPNSARFFGGLLCFFRLAAESVSVASFATEQFALDNFLHERAHTVVAGTGALLDLFNRSTKTGQQHAFLGPLLLDPSEQDTRLFENRVPPNQLRRWRAGPGRVGVFDRIHV